MNTVDLLLNLVIFVITTVLVVLFGRKEGQWVPERWRKAFRYFTCQSNVLCAAAGLLTAAFGLAGDVPEWVWLVKYAGTAAVTLTMLTVFLYLAPVIGEGWVEKLLTGKISDLFMHLITPVLALVSFLVFEHRGMTFPQSLIGMLPILLYGSLYVYKVLFAPEEKRWEDFYGFNRGGKWQISAAAMLVANFLICLGLMALQNI